MNKHPATKLLIAVLAFLIGMGPVWCGCITASAQAAELHHQTANASDADRGDPNCDHADHNCKDDSCADPCTDCAGKSSKDQGILAAKSETPALEFQVALQAVAFVINEATGEARILNRSFLDPPELSPRTPVALRTLLLN